MMNKTLMFLIVFSVNTVWADYRVVIRNNLDEGSNIAITYAEIQSAQPIQDGSDNDLYVFGKDFSPAPIYPGVAKVITNNVPDNSALRTRLVRLEGGGLPTGIMRGNRLTLDA